MPFPAFFPPKSRKDPGRTRTEDTDSPGISACSHADPAGLPRASAPTGRGALSAQGAMPSSRRGKNKRSFPLKEMQMKAGNVRSRMAPLPKGGSRVERSDTRRGIKKPKNAGYILFLYPPALTGKPARAPPFRQGGLSPILPHRLRSLDGRAAKGERKQ